MIEEIGVVLAIVAFWLFIKGISWILERNGFSD
jgi:hypothetical protein